MSDSAMHRDEAGGPPSVTRGLDLPIRLAVACVEMAVGPRGLVVAFLAVAWLLATSGWLRPPLSPDISGMHLPLSILGPGAPPPEEILHGPRQIPPDSAGSSLLVLIAVGAIYALPRPRRLGMVAGLLLCGALAAHAAVVLNHPALIEMLDGERVQRQQVARMLNLTPDMTTLTIPRNGRIPASLPETAVDDAASLARGGEYLLYGYWLVPWAGLGILLGSRGSLSRRLVHLSAWLLAGLGLSLMACFPRLHAESDWVRAQELEVQADYAASRRALEAAISTFPELDGLQRTWLLAGKLDHHEGRPTLRELYFRASLLAAAEQQPLAIAILSDDRGDGGDDRRLVRELAARLWAEIGLRYYLINPVMTGSGRNYDDQDRRLAAAREAWQRAIELSPTRHDCAFYLATIRLRTDRVPPEQLEAELAPLLAAWADPALQADILNILGDAFFEAGQVAKARRFYAASFDLINLPRIKNYWAQKGLGGL